MSRALLIDPDSLNMRYNFACALLIHLKETEAALNIIPVSLGEVCYWLQIVRKPIRTSLPPATIRASRP